MVKMECLRCGIRYTTENEYGLCHNCLKSFKPMVNELRLAFIHHYMHPEKKTIYVHDESKRYDSKLKL